MRRVGQQHVMLKKKEMLVWSPTTTAAETHAVWMTYYESYDRSVALSHNLDDVTLIVPAQDWATRFTVRHRGMETGISEASKRVSIFSS